ncbi:MAG: hypothetical protein HY392_03930 [Candidatus Diapherotrites archaeon]|nr:hypothetical protein [Candidatus Diapherotrites archaeon]
MVEEAKVPLEIKKEIKSASIKAKSADTKAEKALSQDETQKSELKKLAQDVASLKKKGAKKKQLSEYNLFVKRQLQQGRTFLQAVRLWKRQQKATKSLRKKTIKKIAKPIKKKTVKKVAKLRKKAKKTVVKKKTIARPRLKKKSKALPRVSSVKKVIHTLRKRSAGLVFSSEQMKSLSEKIVGLEKKLGSAQMHVSQNTTSPFFLDLLGSVSSEGTHEVSDEEIALKLAGLYFKEVARLGFKRSLELDSVINAYFYSLARIRRKDTESKEIISAVRDSNISSKGF